MDQGSQGTGSPAESGDPSQPPVPPAPPPASPPSGPPGGGWQAAPPPGWSPPPKDQASWLIPLLAGVIAVAVAGIGYLLIFDNDDDDDSGTGSGDQLAAGGQEDGSEAEGEEEDQDGSEAEGGEEDESVELDPDRLTGTWEGTYTCASTIDVVLTLDDYGDGTVGAAWELTTEDGDSGMFHLEGTYDGGQLSLEGAEWAEGLEVDGYDPVSLEADLSDRDDTEHIEGDITDDGCEDFSVERTSLDPWYVGTFEGEYHCSELEGKGGLRLTIEATGQDQSDILVEYYVLPDSTTDIPDGSHTATGVYANRALTMRPGEWIEQPPGYVAVPIISHDEAVTDPHSLIGIIDYPGCSLFALTRVEEGDGDTATEGTDG